MSNWSKSNTPRFGPISDIDTVARKRHAKSGQSSAQVSALMLDAEALSHARKLTPKLTPAQEKEYVSRFLGLTGARPVNASGPIHFGQRSVNPQFSDNQQAAKGMTIMSQAAKLKNKEISPDKFPVTFVAVDRTNITMNNRSLTTLSMAGMTPTVTHNATGKLKPSGPDSAADLLERLHETGTTKQTSMPIRAGKQRDLAPIHHVPLPSVPKKVG